jgi:hypothetical protein
MQLDMVSVQERKHIIMGILERDENSKQTTPSRSTYLIYSIIGATRPSLNKKSSSGKNPRQVRISSCSKDELPYDLLRS